MFSFVKNVISLKPLKLETGTGKLPQNLDIKINSADSGKREKARTRKSRGIVIGNGSSFNPSYWPVYLICEKAFRRKAKEFMELGTIIPR